jgi:hypothetical protein
LTNSVAVQAKIFPDNMLSGSGSSATPLMHSKGDIVESANTGPSSAQVLHSP